MSRVSSPLLSWGASGQIAKTQVYSQWKGRPYVRRYVVPANPNSTDQQKTRNSFKFLNGLWQYMPSGAVAAWQLYANNNQFTPRNGWLKQNVSPLRTASDLTGITLSVAAGSGIIADAISTTATSGGIDVSLTAPSLPTGWSIDAAYALAVKDVDPQSSEEYNTGSGSTASTPWDISLTGLESGALYIVGGWFEFSKNNGAKAYGLSLQTTETPS